MSETIAITEPKVVVNEQYISQPEAKQKNTQGIATDYAVSNKWIGYVPIENVLGSKYKNLELHLTRFSLPQQTMSSSIVSYKGYQKEIPTKVMNAESKELTLEYVVDAGWINYKALYLWMSSINGNINQVVNEEVNVLTPEAYIPIRIYLLDQYKKKLVQFVFDNCWIKVFNDLALECNTPNEVHHSFTICYDNYTIEDV